LTANQWLEEYRRFWEQSFAALDGVLAELKQKKPRAKRRPSR
jgi:hypothetical protein